MADEKKDPKGKDPQGTEVSLDKKLDYCIEALYDLDIQRHGYAVALRRRHEILGDRGRDYKAMFEEGGEND